MQVEQVCGKVDKLINRMDTAVKNGTIQVLSSSDKPFLERSWNQFLEQHGWVVWLLLGWALVKWLGFGEAPKNLLKLFGI